MSVLGLDIGGANIKAAGTAGFSRHVPFALWKNPGGLAQELHKIFLEAPHHKSLAVTMTGELCDCFESKREGVAAILDAVEESALAPIRVWTNEGTFVDPTSARANALKVASANWLALATIAGRLMPTGSAILLDIGTTTTDIIPIVDGKPVPQGRTDPERLKSGELLYRGWRRTPLCALYPAGAAEWFATTHDVYLILNLVPEDPSDHDTADGKPATRAEAYRRLARMMCSDLETCTQQECDGLAKNLNYEMLNQIAGAINKLESRSLSILCSGSGEFLEPIVALLLTVPTFSSMPLGQLWSPALSAAACAHAVAILASEQKG